MAKTPSSKKRKLSLTQKKRNANPKKQTHSQVVATFLETLNMIKLYHWKTHSFSTHKATDELYADMNSNVDEFVEVLLGKDGSRVNLTSAKSIPLYDFNSIGPFKQKIAGLKTYLENMSKCPALMNHSDLLNIRDELLANLNKFTYLLTFK